jgi:hypothetical protein
MTQTNTKNLQKENTMDCNSHLDNTAPNVVVEWFILLVRILEVPGSNLGLETGYPG